MTYNSWVLKLAFHFKKLEQNFYAMYNASSKAQWIVSPDLDY